MPTVLAVPLGRLSQEFSRRKGLFLRVWNYDDMLGSAAHLPEAYSPTWLERITMKMSRCRAALKRGFVTQHRPKYIDPPTRQGNQGLGVPLAFGSLRS